MRRYELAAEREVVAVDLPGFGETPPLPGEVTIATLADALTSFMQEHDLAKVDTVGSSMGARLSLELSRRGIGGATVALFERCGHFPQLDQPRETARLVLDGTAASVT